MIQTRDLVPVAYSGTRDYQVLCKLLDLVIVAAKSDVDNFLNLISPDKCPDHMLKLLASYVGYEYDSNETYDANRLIIKHYNELMRNRGSSTGVSLAVSLAITASGVMSDINLVSLFRIDYDRDTNIISIFLYCPDYISKIKDLVEAVRPAGTRVKIIPAEKISTVDKVEISDYIHYENFEEYLKSDRYKVDEGSRVGFGEVAGDREMNDYMKLEEGDD